MDSKLEEFKRANLHDKIWQDWLENFAESVAALRSTTHPSKFAHPDAKTSAVNFLGNLNVGGFVTSAGIATISDLYCNAGLLGKHKLLKSLLVLTLDDGKTLLEHLEKETELVKKEFSTARYSFSQIKMQLLAMDQASLGEQVTDEKVKQVYFPVADTGDDSKDYHLLSVLLPSGIISELKTRVKDIIFSYREKDGVSPQIFNRLHDISDIKYGGTNSQNISVINGRNKGEFHLLPSMPPILAKRKIRLPKNSLFSECLKSVIYEPYFEKLNKILAKLEHQNNFDNRKSFDNTMEDLFQYIVSCVWQIRKYGIEYVGENWSSTKHYSNLPGYQKILLDDARINERSQATWQDEVTEKITRWIVNSYEKACQKAKVANLAWPDKESWGDDYFTYILEIIRDNKEALL